MFDYDEIGTILDSNDFETLYEITFPLTGDVISVIVNDNGEEYFNDDWQSTQPKTLEECADYRWYTGDQIDF